HPLVPRHVSCPGSPPHEATPPPASLHLRQTAGSLPAHSYNRARILASRTRHPTSRRNHHLTGHISRPETQPVPQSRNPVSNLPGTRRKTHSRHNSREPSQSRVQHLTENIQINRQGHIP